MSFKDQLPASTLKSMVDNLSKYVKFHPLASPCRADIQEAVAQTLGWPNWHAAITRAKTISSMPTPKAVKGEWLVPTLFGSFYVPALKHPCEYPQPLPPPDPRTPLLRLKSKEMCAHAMIWGTEENRREFLDEAFRLNADRPVLLVQGPLSLGLRHGKWHQVGSAAVPEAFSTEPASILTELVVSELPPDSAFMWKPRAISLISSVLFALVHLRDKHDIALSVSGLSEAMLLPSIQRLSEDKRLPQMVSQSLKAYLRSIPGFNAHGQTQSDLVFDQHGDLQMKMIQAFVSIESGKASFLKGLSDASPSRAIAKTTALSESQAVDVQRYIVSWEHAHPGALIVFDGLSDSSTLWPFIVENLVQWRQDLTAVWIGAMSCDRPSSYPALTDRMGRPFSLQAMLDPS